MQLSERESPESSDLRRLLFYIINQQAMLKCFLLIVEALFYYQVGTTCSDTADNRGIIPNNGHGAAAVP